MPSGRRGDDLVERLFQYRRFDFADSHLSRNRIVLLSFQVQGVVHARWQRWSPIGLEHLVCFSVLVVALLVLMCPHDRCSVRNLAKAREGQVEAEMAGEQ